jgi:predicted nucleic acid-binding protein
VIFWDASAIVPLLVAERRTAGVRALARGDQDMLVWWGSTVECFSALARLEREAALDAKAMTLAAGRLEQIAGSWHEIEPTEVVRESALRFLRVHALRGRRVAVGGGLHSGRTPPSVASVPHA